MHSRIDRDNFALLKTALRTILPKVGSSHADEALAAYFGYRTYASLKAVLPDPPAFLDVEGSPEQLVSRLSALGHKTRPPEIDRMLRLFLIEIRAHAWEDIRRMATTPANDNL